MSIWNKILLVLIFFCVIGVFYLGAKSLSNRSANQKKLQQIAISIEKEKEKNSQILYGNEDGLEKLNAQVATLRKLQDARTWFRCQPVSPPQVADKDVTLQLVIARDTSNTSGGGNASGDAAGSPAPDAAANPAVVADPSARIPLKTTVYLFDQRSQSEGGVFLGEFSVEKADAQGITLKNSLLMTNAEIEKIAASQSTNAEWAVYTVLPTVLPGMPSNAASPGDAGNDSTSAQTAAASDVTENASAVENAVVAENTGTGTDTADALGALVKDYSALHLKRTQLLKDIDMLQRQIKSLESADVQGKELSVSYQKEIDSTKASIAEDQMQRQEVSSVKAALDHEIQQMTTQIATLKALNKKILADLTVAQVQAADEITRQEASTVAP
ncbi:MAG: hypothetical protein FWC50_07710 [Planctomycetaceae bacterium]|nr:hypothetical protein [Planctomycetaceae bacterium]